jgi:transposase-like protein
MDERVLTIKGERHYLWRAVDQDGTVLDILVQRRRNKRAAKQFFRTLLKGVTYAPRVIVPDGTVKLIARSPSLEQAKRHISDCFPQAAKRDS